MDLLSPHLPPPSTVRRNPPRKAKQSSSIHALVFSNSSKPAAIATNGSVGISAFPLEELLQPEPPQVHPPPDPKPFKSNEDASNNLKIFLRIRSLEGRAEIGAPRSGKGSKEALGMNSRCLCVNSSTSVTLNAPPLALDSKRAKSEVYDGFSCVFPPESIQEDIYDKVMQPMVMGFLEGQSSLLVAMGPTGSGKTYTMFGSAQQLGIVPLALRQIFKHKNEHENIQATRTYYLSMFEIYSERGKGEKIFDLSPESIDLPHQQSSINSVKEVHISNVTDAEKIVAYGMHKRSTASTNANNLSSRSQCVINISSVLKSDNGEHLLSNPILTIADLAGAERERRTGNQGPRLMESNFINNTSMVFGLCLRSLLEHQKNPKKPIEKHYKNSLLTRYLQDYMEGKKRMTLILTVKAGKVDYMDTTFVLRQASPYMKIKFNHLQENTKLQCQKRTITSTGLKKSKRRKVGISEASLIDGDDVVMDAAIRSQISEKGSIAEGSNVKQDNEEFLVELQKTKRSEEVMKNFARALLSMLKQYKFKLKESENEVQFLKENLREQCAHAAELGKELKELRCSCSCLNNPPVEECAGHLPFDHCDGVPLLPVDQDVALPDENHASLDSENEVQFLKENLRVQSAHAAEIGKELEELRCSCSCLNNPPVEECAGHLPVDHCDGVPLLPVDQDIALPDENHASLVEFSSGPYSGLFLEDNAKEQSYQYLDENPERSQKSTQTELKLGGEDGVVVDMPDIASLLGPHDNVPVSKSEFSEETSNPDYCILRSCDPFEREGCNLHLDGSEGTTIMQAKKEQQEKFAMLDDVQQDSSSNGTALKISAHDPALRPLNSTRPKRKLLPASAMLLKDLNGLDMDDNAKDIKGKANSYAKERSDGSISLIRILRNNLPR